MQGLLACGRQLLKVSCIYGCQIAFGSHMSFDQRDNLAAEACQPQKVGPGSLVCYVSPSIHVFCSGSVEQVADIMQESSRNSLFIKAFRFSQSGALKCVLELRHVFTIMVSAFGREKLTNKINVWIHVKK